MSKEEPKSLELSYFEPPIEQKTTVLYSKLQDDELGQFSVLSLKLEDSESDQKEHIVTQSDGRLEHDLQMRDVESPQVQTVERIEDSIEI